MILLFSVNDKKLKIGFNKNDKLEINNLEYEYSILHINNSTYLLKIGNENFSGLVKIRREFKIFCNIKGTCL